MDIIELIERTRKEKRILKQALCKLCKINRNTYTNYLNGGKVPYNVAVEMLAKLDKQIIIIDKI